MEELKATNLKLHKHLDQAMDKFELIFGEKVSLENFNEALQVWPPDFFTVDVYWIIHTCSACVVVIYFVFPIL